VIRKKSHPDQLIVRYNHMTPSVETTVRLMESNQPDWPKWPYAGLFQASVEIFNN